jgi:hypothetical protein
MTYLVELDYIGVADKLENMYFSRNSLDIVYVGDFLLFEDLDCDLGEVKDGKVELTFSPVRLWVPSFTFPNVPSPIVLPKGN